MEELLYEFRPHICLAIGLYSLLGLHSSQFVVGCGVVLLFCSGYLYNLRTTNRNKSQVKRHRR